MTAKIILMKVYHGMENARRSLFHRTVSLRIISTVYFMRIMVFTTAYKTLMLEAYF